MQFNPFSQLLLYGRLVKFSHSVFALPFALSMFVVTTAYAHFSWRLLVAIIICMFAARTAAMAFNRLLDRDIDAINPRTQARELPSGQIQISQVILLILLSATIFIVSAWSIGAHCLLLSPLVLAILFFYSWTKRFTSMSHLVLGLTLGLAPGAVWYAMTAIWAWQPVPLMLAVIFWVAGFDVLYACQDLEFDRKNKLFSIPVKFGLESAFKLARIFHFTSVVFLVCFGLLNNLQIYYFVGVFIFALIIASQHAIISPNDLSRMDQAFFTRNGLASVCFLIFVTIDRILV